MEIEKLLRQLSAVKSENEAPTGHDKRGFIRLNLLTQHISERRSCELCSRTGTISCFKCRVTYYCTVEHFLSDKEFHACICARNKTLRQPVEFHPMKEVRERWAKQRQIRMEEIFNYTWKKGQTFLEEGQFAMAIPSAAVATQFAVNLYGEMSEQCIPPLLIAAESFIRTNKLNVADAYIARTLTVEMISPTRLRPSYKARIRHNEGLMAIARDRLNEAIDRFSEEIYQTTEEFGPEHINTSLGYCYLGHVFHKLSKYAISMSIHKQTVSIWVNYLDPIIMMMTAQSDMPEIAGVKTEEKVWMDECDKLIGQSILLRCYLEQMECFEVEKATVKPTVSANVIDIDVSPTKHVSLTDLKPSISVLDVTQTCYGLSILNFICEKYLETEKYALEGKFYLDKSQHHDDPITKKFNHILKHARRKLYQLEKQANQQSSTTSVSLTGLLTPLDVSHDLESEP